jgi:hypothetical protein
MIPLVLKKWVGIPHTCKNPKSIFIGLIGGVGDLILAAPSVAALKQKFPEARITFGVGDGLFFNTIKNDPNIDHFETPFFYNVCKKAPPLAHIPSKASKPRFGSSARQSQQGLVEREKTSHRYLR